MDLTDLLPGKVKVSDLPDAALAAGLHAFTAADAAKLAGIEHAMVGPALARLIHKNLAFSPARGLYIPIEPEFRSWGVVPAERFIDQLMRHLNRSYYVAFLTAAQLHGAAHQRPQTFQVVVDRATRDRDIGRVKLRFVTSRDVQGRPKVSQNTPTGTMQVSSSEVTALDLAHHPEHGGALHNVATVLTELADRDKLDDDALRTLIDRYPAAASRRVGWIVERFTLTRFGAFTDAAAAASRRPSLLDPFGPRRGRSDPRWQLRINSPIEPDR